MTIYLALLRGINVGGKNIIKMVQLKKAFEDLGFSQVKTYIQSGNVLFKSDKEEKELIEIIEQKIQAVFGFSAAVLLRTAEELKNIISSCPFTKEEILKAEASSDVESLYVSLLSCAPLAEKADLLKAYESESDKYCIIGREVFLLFSNSIRNSKLASNLYKLDAAATVRNWKTINKLLELTKDMES